MSRIRSRIRSSSGGCLLAALGAAAAVPPALAQATAQVPSSPALWRADRTAADAPPPAGTIDIPAVKPGSSAAASAAPVAVIGRIVLDAGQTLFEGTAEPGSLVELADGQLPVGVAPVDGTGRWNLVVNRVFAPGEHRFLATPRDPTRARRGSTTEVMVDIPKSIAGSVVVHRAAVGQSERPPATPETRVRPPAGAGNPDERFGDAVTSPEWRRIAQLAPTKAPPPPRSAPVDAGGPSSVFGWLDRAARDYQEIIVKQLSDSRSTPMGAPRETVAAPAPRSPVRTVEPGQAPAPKVESARQAPAAELSFIDQVQDWMSRSGREYYDGIVRKLSVQDTVASAPRTEPRPAPATDRRAEEEALRKADLERRLAAEQKAAEERRSAEQKAAEARRLAEQRAAEQKTAEAARPAPAVVPVPVAPPAEDRAAAEARRLEEERRMAEARRLDEQRASEARAEAERRQAEARRAEEDKRRAAELAKAEEAQRAFEEARREAQRRAQAQIEQTQVDERRRQEAAAGEAQQRQAEQQRVADLQRQQAEQRRADQERQAELQRRAEQERLAAQRRIEPPRTLESVAAPSIPDWRRHGFRSEDDYRRALAEASRAPKETTTPRRTAVRDSERSTAERSPAESPAPRLTDRIREVLTRARERAAPSGSSGGSHHGYSTEDEYRRALSAASRAPKEDVTTRTTSATRAEAERRAQLMIRDEAQRVVRLKEQRERTSAERRRSEDQRVAARAPKVIEQGSAARGPVDRTQRSGLGAGAGRRSSSDEDQGPSCPDAGRRVALPGSYVVKNGDSLWSIAERHYGDGERYRQIVRANRRRVPDPNAILPCTKLVLPRKGS